MRRVWPWVVMAPLGCPVVPEVKIRSERSPEVIEAVRPAATSAEHRAALLAGRPPSRPTGSPLAVAGVDRVVVAGAEDHHPLEVGHRLAGGHRLVEHRRVVDAEEPVAR